MTKNEVVALLKQTAKEAELVKLAAEQHAELFEEAETKKELEKAFGCFEEGTRALRRTLNRIDYKEKIYELLVFGMEGCEA